MPTYLNNSLKPIAFSYGYGSTKVVDPDETLVTDQILNIPGLKLISDEPYYNPLHKKDTLIGSSGSQQILISEESKFLFIIMIKGRVQILINSPLNTPSIDLVEGLNILLPNDSRIFSLIVTFQESSELIINHYDRNITFK
jgi:hypothetical protein